MIPYTYEDLKHKSAEYIPSELVKQFGFENSLILSKQMLMNEKWDESLQAYAAKLLEEIRKSYPKEWNASWKYDAFLGYAYHILLKYDERYAAYKNALEKIQSPPPELLIAMARCCIAPGTPPLSDEEAISLSKQAIQNVPYVEGIELLIRLYKSAGNVKEQQHWVNVLEKMGKDVLHLPSLEQLVES